MVESSTTKMVENTTTKMVENGGKFHRVPLSVRVGKIDRLVNLHHTITMSQTTMTNLESINIY